MSAAPDRRLLLVHAHPDDESINNGATMAKYAAEGVHVTLVTCTLGEEGEVIPAELAHLAPGQPLPGQPPPGRQGPGRQNPEPRSGNAQPEQPPGDITPLGRHRMGELARAMRELGVTDHRLLGGPGRYRDSGMMGLSTNTRPGCFWQAPIDEAALHLVRVVREVRPQVMVTYDPDGGYGHPDHIQAHRVAMRAAELAADAGFAPGAGEPHEVARVYWNCVPRPVVEADLARLREDLRHPSSPYAAVAQAEDVPGLVRDESSVDAVVDGRSHAEAKAAAMRAHATQIAVHGDTFALSNGLGQPLISTEYYRLAHPARDHAGGISEDLFAGAGA
ncbi:1D-myo-inositol 2-acetamido-2-deoxy-alpha-D-glucopyranoside deacetylase [Streptomyces abyssalis]|uniref:1D-myo-inositol 2-acetamido-2-deoxy-alpha-D-glucopyranoside deacetylase n=1 Tax=Streptomyces abyssalis TaxID=933944 RepID=A0A1E7JG83_9ACTN|nr:N-acetyl-1-D-myo-inositol-2-amino-2-deoxy-alpha-D-glucopyranoside deacetylase [Streptomyces abyssalis]OEU85485.1 1D-myo-inositol 2-acetamido-2-deoxy-alpha-D-glucopyranoside deacetylase [Streptomyces abyssalis]OEU93052.1 1D-myo-inositol 2-acetamido-2-deoxy-alpha-D-glucopyranoside deacetylase [Streptomyces abyssalis]